MKLYTIQITIWEEYTISRGSIKCVYIDRSWLMSLQTWFVVINIKIIIMLENLLLHADYRTVDEIETYT